MAILGFQLVATLIGASILSKVVTYFSFARLIFRGLTRCSVPTDQQLLDMAGSAKLKTKGKRRRTDGSNDHGIDASSDVFYVPRSTPIQLNPTTITYSEFSRVPFYDKYQWLVDFCVCTVGVYTVTEMYYGPLGPWVKEHFFHPPNTTVSNYTVQADPPYFTFFGEKFNLSLVWCALVFWFSLRNLLSLTHVYLRRRSTTTTAQSSGFTLNTTSSSTPDRDYSECMLILAASFVSLIAAVFCLIYDGRYLDFGIVAAHTNLSASLNATDQMRQVYISLGTFQAIIAICAATLGALFFFPGLRYGKMYLDAIRSSAPLWVRITLHVSFLAPLLPLLLWLTPVIQHLPVTLLAAASHFKNPSAVILLASLAEYFSSQLDSIRLQLCLMVLFLRFSTIKWHLQAYLNFAQEKIRLLNREPGKISNREVQRMIASVFYCINLVALQYLTPAIMLLSLLCLYKNMSRLCWSPVPCNHSLPSVQSSVNQSFFASPMDPVESLLSGSWFQAITEARATFARLADHLAIRGQIVARGVLGFSCWWCLACWQVMSLLGLTYHQFAST